MSDKGATPADNVTATSDVSIQIQNSISVPNRTLLVSEDDSTLFGDDSYTLTAIKRAATGDTLEVNVTAPDSLNYQVEIRDDDLNIQGASTEQSGDSTVTLDTGTLDTGTYLVAPVDTSDTTAVAVHPLIVKAYTTTITSAPDTIKSNETLTVEADLDDAVSGPPSLEDVVLGGFTDSDETGIAVQMDQIDSSQYSASISDPPDDEYQLHVAPRGTNTVSFTIESLTIEEETTSGDTLSQDESTDTIITASGPEPLGLSDASNVTVELADADVLEQVWSQATGSANVQGQLQFSRVAVNNENVYVGGLDELVTAHARNSGELRWSYGRSGNLVDSSPVLVERTNDPDVIYIGGGGGLLHAINAEIGATNEGNAIWTYDTATAIESAGSAVTSTPAVQNGKVFAAASDGVVHAVQSDGTPDWTTDIGAGVYSDVEVGELNGSGLVFLTTTDGRIVILDAIDGDFLFDIEAFTDSFGSSSPLYDSGVLYVAGDIVHAIDVETTLNEGSERFVWQQSGYGGSSGSSPVLADGILYVGSSNARLYAIDSTDGDIPWATPENGAPVDEIASRPAVVSDKDKVVVGSLDGSMYVVDRFTGDVVNSRSIGDPIRSDPVVVNDDVYVGTEAGDVLNLQNIP